jgi:hypothetical protein
LLKFDDARDPRPEPRAVGSERYWAPTDDGEYYSDNDLPTLRFAAAPELQVQLFNRWFDPQTMLPCGPGNAVMRNGAFIGTTTESGARCARYQGAYVERVADGRLLHVLSHGVGVSHAIAAQGRLVAIGGRSEGLTLDGKPDPAQPNFVSLWDAIAGERLANLAFPPGDFSVRACCSRPMPVVCMRSWRPHLRRSFTSGILRRSGARWERSNAAVWRGGTTVYRSRPEGGLVRCALWTKRWSRKDGGWAMCSDSDADRSTPPQRVAF